MRPVDGDDTPPSAPYQEGVIRRTTSRPPAADAAIRRTTSNAKANGVPVGDTKDEKSELKHQFSISATPAASTVPGMDTLSHAILDMPCTDCCTVVVPAVGS